MPNSRRDWFLFSLITFVLVSMGLGYYFDLQPTNHLLQQRQAEVHDLKRVLNQMNAIIKKQAVISKKYKTLMSTLRVYRRVDNKSIIVSSMYSAIFQGVEKYSLTVESFIPGAWAMQNNLNVLPLKLVVKGAFNQCVAFILSISHSSIPIAMLDFTAVDTNERLVKLEMELVGYFIPGPISNPPNLTKAKVFQLRRDPFVALDRSALQLLSVPTRSIHWVGYVSDANQCWAIALLPNHKAFPVFPGSVLGLEKTKVVRLDEKAVWLELNGKSYQRHYYLEENYGV